MMVPVLSFSQEQPLPEYSNPPALISAGLSFHIAMEKIKEAKVCEIRAPQELSHIPHPISR